LHSNSRPTKKRKENRGQSGVVYPPIIPANGKLRQEALETISNKQIKQKKKKDKTGAKKGC
jgi:hypothetical protein